MSSISQNGQETNWSLSVGRPAGLYLWVVSAIFLVQGFLVVSGAYRTIVYMTDKLEAGLPSEYWWTTIDVRASAWLLMVPLLAAIIVDRRSSLWSIGLLHLMLISFAVLISGNLLHRFAHIQADQRAHLIEFKNANTDQASSSKTERNGDSERSLAPASTVTYQAKDYEGVTFHKSYGISYWLGELSLIVASYVLIGGVGYAVLYFRLTEYRKRQADRLRTTLTQLQHESLCNRLQPHFLFNTLNTISSLTLTDGEAARTCISQLGGLLRESVDSLPEGEIRLDRETEILEMYLKIQKTRFGEKLDYTIKIEEGLSAVLVPAFVLQPLVENSFKHGFHEQGTTAHLVVSAKREGDSCRLEVSDNGAGMNPAQELEEKYGLGLTRQRLRLQYDDQASITFEPNQPQGFRVILLVPYRLHEEKVA